jgi:putative nucleotidyltransferase with HDIG domain
MTAGVGFILASDLLLARHVSVVEGQAASEDIVAPFRIEFVSDILTEAERKRAVTRVTRVYDPLDRQVGREQVNLALQVLSFVDSVRSDSYASPAYQRFCLESIESVALSSQVISDVLQLADEKWQVVQSETRQVLSRVMQDEIKSEQEDAARLEVRSLIDLGLNESQTAIVDEIASALVKANRVYNQAATETAQQAAYEGVEAQVRVMEENQIVVRSGEIVTDLDIEALEALDLLTLEIEWLTVGGVFLFALLLSVSTSVYLWHNKASLLDRPHHLLLLLLLLLVFALLTKWGLSLAPSQQYLVPLATLGMLVTVLFDPRLGVTAHAVLCLVVAYIADGQLGLFLYELAGGLVGLFALRQIRRINTFIWAGAYVMLANAVAVIAFSLLTSEPITLLTGQLVLSGVVNGALSAVVTLGGYYLLGMIFNITTALQLLDLARPTHPLMRELLLKAPGTYHHSIMVGNMAEQAAEAVGANALLARVGAFYHDIGKTVRPYFFTENQMEGSNPHDLLDPGTSAQIIRSHTRDGLELARRYRLPKVIQAFITEHHGTGKIGYFYHKAVQEYGEEQVQEVDYRHLGPTPQSPESAIVMMADSCEAAVRSVRPQDPEELERLIHNMVGGKLSSGQLSDVPLTLQEISVVTSSFIDTLQGVFHPRVRYPGSEKLVAPPEAERALEARPTPEVGSPGGQDQVRADVETEDETQDRVAELEEMDKSDSGADPSQV